MQEETIYDYLSEEELFERLNHLGYTLGIVTGRPREDMAYLLERFNLYPYFDFVVDEDFNLCACLYICLCYWI